VPSDFGHTQEERTRDEQEFSGVSSYIRQQPGAAMCEELLLCFAAGKPDTYDAFAGDQLVRTGAIPVSQLVDLVARREYKTIQMNWGAGEAVQPAARARFPGPVMRAVFANYTPSIRSPRYVVFTAKPQL
jgi:hypothetical protein